MSNPSSEQRHAWVALGANLGDARRTVVAAMDALQALSLESIERSSLWSSAPVGCPPGAPDFVNAVVRLVPLPGESAETLLDKLQQQERAAGFRPRLVRNEPRPLDLDLIAFGTEVRSTPHLVLPHPRAHERRFVLAPMAEIDPRFVLPGHRLTVSELLTRVGADQVIRRLTP